MNQANLLPLTPPMRGEYFDAIKRLAHERFIQLEMGTDADFEELWRDAFFVNRTSESSNKRNE